MVFVCRRQQFHISVVFGTKPIFLISIVVLRIILLMSYIIDNDWIVLIGGGLLGLAVFIGLFNIQACQDIITLKDVSIQPLFW